VLHEPDLVGVAWDFPFQTLEYKEVERRASTSTQVDPCVEPLTCADRA